MADYVPYHEPSLVQILILTSFVVFLNAFRLVCDHIANAGILGKSGLVVLGVCHVVKAYTHALYRRAVCGHDIRGPAGRSAQQRMARDVRCYRLPWPADSGNRG